MKVLSMWDPWATLLCLEEKRYETRSWSLKHFGWHLIHVSQKIDWDSVEQPQFKSVLRKHFGNQIGEGLERTRGHIIGAAYFKACYHTEHIRDRISAQERAFGDYGDGRFAWEIAKAVRFLHPRPAKGALYLWPFDETQLHPEDHELFLTFKPTPEPFMGAANV